jgi:DNA-binding MarR family transcriptional regulator
MNLEHTLGSPVELFTRNMFTQIIQKLSAYLAEENYTISEIAALHIIYRSKGLSVQALSKNLNLSISATSRLVSGLVKEKLLRAKEDEKDGRAKIISCTKSAEQLLDQMSLERIAAVLEVAQTLPPNISNQILKAVSQYKKEV